MFGNVYGLDLGSYEIKVYDKKSDTIWQEKDVIAIANEKQIFSVGDEAYEMYEKTPENIEIVFPMKEGVISHFYHMQYLLQNLLKKERRFVRGSKYIIAVPTDVTEVEKRAFYDLVIHSTARAREVRIVERCIADALGLGLDVTHSSGIFIANLGAETMELSVIASGGMVLNKLVKTGGFECDKNLASAVRYEHEFLIGRITAEELRKYYDISEEHLDDTKKISGRDLVTGVPQMKEISGEFVRASIEEFLNNCTTQISTLLERTPPEVRKNIERTGIYLTGGLAKQKGLSKCLEERLNVKVNTSETPEICSVMGLKKIVQTKELKKLTYSMLDGNYKWVE